MNKIKLFPFVLGAISAVSLSGCGKTVEEPNPEPAHTHSYALKHDGNSHWQECTCGDKKDIAAHSFVEASKTPATCTSTEIIKYQCSVCGEQKEVSGKETLDHRYRLVETVEATCQKPGKLVYGCESCSDKKEIEIADVNAHNYGRSSKADSVITYFCVNEGCSSSYKVIDAKTQEKATVTSKEIGEVGAIELKEATIALDSQTLLGFGKDVTIGAEKLTSEEVAQKVTMSEETKALIQDAPVFDFSAKDGEEDVHEFLGKVTITIPYELQAGEDPNGLSVAYINDAGGVEHMPATYRNGLVSFETTHFSVYALVKMSAEEACAKFGHIYSHLSTKESTCIKAGHETHVCTRCGATEERPLPLVDHNFVFSSSKESTKTEHGYIEYKCDMCDATKREELPLLPTEDNGFAMNLISSIASQNIKCTEAEIYKGETYEESYYVCLNDNKNFIAESRDGEITYFDDGVKNYSISYERDSNVDYVRSIFERIKAAPKSVVNVVDFVANVLTNTLLTRTETETGYLISLDSSKIINKIYESAKTKDVVTLIDMVFGEGFYNKVYDLAANFAVRTVQESFNALNSSFGFEAKEIWDFVKVVGNAKFPAFDKFFTKDILDTKGSEILKMLPSEIADILGSKASLDAFIDTFKGMTIFELLDQFLHVGFAEHMEEINEMVNSVCNGGCKLEIRTTKNGQFISGAFDIDSSVISKRSNGSSLRLMIDTEFDMDGVYAAGQKIIADRKKLDDAFKPGNQAFIDNVLSKMYEGISFKYYESYLTYQDVYVSEKTTIFDKYLDLPEGTEVELILRANPDYYYKFNDNHNMYDGENLYETFVDVSVQTVHILNPDGVSEYIDGWELNYNRSTYVVYDIDSGAYFFSSAYSAYSNSHLYQYKEISEEEYYSTYSYGPYPVPDTYEKPHYYEGTCVVCGETTRTAYFDTDLNGQVRGTLISPLMNEEARKYYFDFNSFYSGNEGFRIHVYKMYDVKFSQNEEMVYYLDDLCKNENKVFTFGNVSIEYTFKPRSGYDCSIICTVVVKIDGKQIVKASKNIHNYYSTERVETVVSSTECYKQIFVQHICTTCGEVVDSYYTGVSSHNYVPQTVFEGNSYVGSLINYVCTKCGDQYQSSSSPNQHTLVYDSEKDSYYCSDCNEYINLVEHYHFADIDSVLPEGVTYRDNSLGSNKYITIEEFRYYNERGYYEYMDFWNLFNYQISLVVAKLDGDNLDIADGGTLGITYENRTYLDLFYNNMYFKELDVICLDANAVQALLDVLAANEGYGLYICITDTSVTGNTFVCPFSFAS